MVHTKVSIVVQAAYGATVQLAPTRPVAEQWAADVCLEKIEEAEVLVRRRQSSEKVVRDSLVLCPFRLLPKARC